MIRFTESVVEDAALDILESLGYTTLHGDTIAPEAPGEERNDFGRSVE